MIGGMCRRALALVLGVSFAACSGPGARSPRAVDVGPHAGLVFVPPTATYVIATTRLDDALRVTRDALDGFGMLVGVDAAAASRELSRALGFDPLSDADLAAQGFDPTRGPAIWADGGVGPVLALPVAEPARVAARIEQLRGTSAVVQVERIEGREVSTWRPDHDVALHWTFVDDWLLVHLEIVEEREAPAAWLRGALAARGALAGSADLAALGAATAARVSDAAAIGLLRLDTLRATRVGKAMGPCLPLFAGVGRVYAAARADASGAQGTIVFELPGGTDGVAAAMLPPPPGWSATRGEAPLVVEAGVDLRQVQAAIGACIGPDVLQDAIGNGVFGGRMFARRADLDDLAFEGAVAARVDPGVVARYLDEIPGLDFLSKKRTVAGQAVVSVNVPMVPAFSYAQQGEALVLAIETAIDPLLTGAGPDPSASELLRVEVRPQAWSADQWSALLRPLVRRDRARSLAVRALRQWTLGQLLIVREPGALVFTARGAR